MEKLPQELTLERFDEDLVLILVKLQALRVNGELPGGTQVHIHISPEGLARQIEVLTRKRLKSIKLYA